MALYNYYDEYVNNLDKVKKEYENAEYYVTRFAERINGNDTVQQVTDELYKIIYGNNISGDLKNDLVSIADSYPENGNPRELETQLNDYIKAYRDRLEEEKNKQSEDVEQIKNDFLEDEVKKPLEEAGIEFKGNLDDVKIDSESDMEKIGKNVTETVDHYDIQKEVLGNENSEKIELNADVLNKAVDSPNTDTILDASLEEQNLSEPIIKETEDGSIEVDLDKKNVNTLAFTAAMFAAAGTIISLGSNLDMKIIKNSEDTSNFKVIYGNFPLKDHPENKLAPEFIDKAKTSVQAYNPNIDYLNDVLAMNSPELAEVIRIVDNHMLDRTGAFQIAVKSDPNNLKIAFGLDENYSDVITAFKENGTLIDSNNKNKVIIPNEQQLDVLESTNESLTLSKNNTKNSNYQKVMKFEQPKTELNEAANATTMILLTSTVASVIILMAYIIMLLVR